jgi:PAS domain S-box-containing protein
MEKTASLEKAEKELRTAQHRLEIRVEERTAELREANDRLLREIRERKQAEEALRESENRLRTIVEGTQALLANVDANGYFTYANDATARAVGYASPKELIGKPYLHFIHPEDRQQVLDTFINQVNTRQPSIMQEFRITDTEGKVKWFSFLSTLAIKDGHFVGQSGVAQEITDRKQAEAALRESENKFKYFAEQSFVGIYLIQDGVFQYVNPRLAEIFGYSVEECDKLDFRNLVFPEDLEKAVEQVRKRILDKVDFAHHEFRGIKKNREVVDLEIYGSSISYEGKPAAIGTILDITDRKRGEEEREKLEAQNLQLQKAESLGRMAGAIAHHFNNQLGVVIGNLELATKSISGIAKPIRFLDEAMKAAFKAADMSGLMLTYLGQTRGKCELIDLSTVSRLSLSMIQEAMPSSITLNSDLPSPGPTISGNAKQIQQVITNLVTNAWEALGESRGVINLTVKTVSVSDIPAAYNLPIDWKQQDNAYACIEVADTGYGISDEEIEKIFDPFFQASSSAVAWVSPWYLGL